MRTENVQFISISGKLSKKLHTETIVCSEVRKFVNGFLNKKEIWHVVLEMHSLNGGELEFLLKSTI